MNKGIGRLSTRCLLYAGLVGGPAVSMLAAQATPHPQPGDSIRVRFNVLDVWHIGVVADSPGDTLIISGCQDCRTEFLTAKSVFQIEIKPRAGGTRIDMHVSPGPHIRKAVGIGAGVGLVAGLIHDSRCNLNFSNAGGRKPGCIPVATVIFPFVGALAGLLGGIATGPTDEPMPNDWVPAAFPDQHQ